MSTLFQRTFWVYNICHSIVSPYVLYFDKTFVFQFTTWIHFTVFFSMFLCFHKVLFCKARFLSNFLTNPQRTDWLISAMTLINALHPWNSSHLGFIMGNLFTKFKLEDFSQVIYFVVNQKLILVQRVNNLDCIY